MRKEYDDAQFELNVALAKLKAFDAEVSFALRAKQEREGINPAELATAQAILDNPGERTAVELQPFQQLADTARALDKKIQKADQIINETKEERAARRLPLEEAVATVEKRKETLKVQLETGIVASSNKYAAPQTEDAEIRDRYAKLRQAIEAFRVDTEKPKALEIALRPPPPDAGKDTLRVAEALGFEVKFTQALINLRGVYQEALNNPALKKNDKRILEDLVNICAQCETLLKASLQDLNQRENQILEGGGSEEDKKRLILEMRAGYFVQTNQNGEVILNQKFAELLHLQMQGIDLKKEYDKSESLQKVVSETAGFDKTLHNPVIFFQQFTKYPSLMEAVAKDSQALSPLFLQANQLIDKVAQLFNTGSKS